MDDAMRAKAKRKEKTKLQMRAKRELLKIEGRAVEIILRANPRARRFIVKVDPSTGEVSVVAPSSRSLDRALDFARKEKNWIADRLADIPTPVPLEPGGPVLYRGVEHIIRMGEPAQGAARRGPVWIDREAARPTIRVSGRPEHAARRVLDWLKREARQPGRFGRRGRSSAFKIPGGTVGAALAPPARRELWLPRAFHNSSKHFRRTPFGARVPASKSSPRRSKKAFYFRELIKFGGRSSLSFPGWERHA
jgi:hypothetical protein